MSRGWARLLLLASLLPLGCDALSVNAFSGAVIEMSLKGAAPLPAGQHLELWARNANNDMIRVAPFYDETNYKFAPGLIIKTAVAPNDPCLIDNNGNLLTTPGAYPSPVTINGVTQSPAQQAQQVIDRIAQLNAMPAGKESATLYAVLPWSVAVEPTLAANTAPADRLAACSAYWAPPPAGAPSPVPGYVPNPYQITAPLHGFYYGAVSFTTPPVPGPPTNYDGIRLDVPVNLKGLQELWMTIEGDTVNPLHRGPVYLDSTLVPGGRDVPHFTFSSGFGVGGEASVYTNLDEAPAQF